MIQGKFNFGPSRIYYTLALHERPIECKKSLING
jgi:hypothetical protein